MRRQSILEVEPPREAPPSVPSAPCHCLLKSARLRAGGCCEVCAPHRVRAESELRLGRARPRLARDESDEKAALRRYEQPSKRLRRWTSSASLAETNPVKAPNSGRAPGFSFPQVRPAHQGRDCASAARHCRCAGWPLKTNVTTCPACARQFTP